METRFIPNRAALDLQQSAYELSEGTASAPNDENTLAGTQQPEAAPGADEPPRARILAFTCRPQPVADIGENRNAVLFQQQRSTIPQNKAIHRRISATPERVLDAPQMTDDYYLNLLDWNQHNILAVALGNAVYLWNATTGDNDKLVELPEGQLITSVSWCPRHKSNIIAVGTSGKDVQLWDADRKMQMRNLRGHEDRVASLAWNGSIVSAGSRDTSIINFDVRLPDPRIATMSGFHQQEVCSLRWSPDGTQLASGGNDNQLFIWDSMQLHQPLHSLMGHQGAVKAMAWCPLQPNLLASGGGSADRTIKIWNTSSAACLNSIDTESQVCSLLWSKYDMELLSSHGFRHNQLCLWSYPSMVKFAELRGHEKRVLHLAMSPDGTTVCSGSPDESLRFWKVFRGANDVAKGAPAEGGEATGRGLQTLQLR
ncbi:putative Cell division cycle 20.1; cofactor of APC complex [Paratrimastix pyriformis]|uniref:Cell division cycle 20.1 n=1 Tax=Paratrimastix pyriformis TaxID=342808 RepID=A0ABQ8UDZ4_9EUKA|nr:putative Cell division cycle 20.1; cofactor of APC complex [Paratrimastix pyriformis]